MPHRSEWDAEQLKEEDYNSEKCNEFIRDFSNKLLNINTTAMSF